jgi:Zn finger protein HypA/HybF involved in hydrogenase expression
VLPEHLAQSLMVQPQGIVVSVLLKMGVAPPLILADINAALETVAKVTPLCDARNLILRIIEENSRCCLCHGAADA